MCRNEGAWPYLEVILQKSAAIRLLSFSLVLSNLLSPPLPQRYLKRVVGIRYTRDNPTKVSFDSRNMTCCFVPALFSTPVNLKVWVKV